MEDNTLYITNPSPALLKLCMDKRKETKKDFGKFVIIPKEQIKAERCKGYKYLF